MLLLESVLGGTEGGNFRVILPKYPHGLWKAMYEVRLLVVAHPEQNMEGRHSPEALEIDVALQTSDAKKQNGLCWLIISNANRMWWKGNNCGNDLGSARMTLQFPAIILRCDEGGVLDSHSRAHKKLVFVARLSLGAFLIVLFRSCWQRPKLWPKRQHRH